MLRVLIVGYGNPLRGDDGLGWEAAARLAGTLSDPAIEIRAVHQLTPDLAEAASRAETVIFIDASCDNGAEDENNQNGVISRRIAPNSFSPQAFSHQLTPEVVLGMAQALYGAAPKGFLVTLPGRSFEFGEGLSPAISAALTALIDRVSEIAGGQAPLGNEAHDEKAQDNRR
jgi:hydrogenase maturation protease